MTELGQINDIARKIKNEVNNEVDLKIGDMEDHARAVPVLMQRMDNICSMMDYQIELIKNAELDLTEAKFQYERKKLLAKQKYNNSFVQFKTEDRAKPKEQRRTDKEIEAMAELESEVIMMEEITAQREFIRCQHKMDDEKHNYEVLNNHFLSYRKCADLLSSELKRFGDNNVVMRNSKY